MRWLVSKWHGIGMRWNVIFMVRDGWAGMVFYMKLEWGNLVMKIGMRVLCMEMINLLIDMLDPCQCVNPWDL